MKQSREPQYVENGKMHKNSKTSPKKMDISDDEKLLQQAKLAEMAFLSAAPKKMKTVELTEEDEKLSQLAKSVELSLLEQNNPHQSTENTSKSNKKSMKLSTEDVNELAAAILVDEEDNRQHSLDHLNCLISRFKHSNFHAMQWDIIRSVMIEKRDVFAIMPTGYGKSLCFQVKFKCCSIGFKC